MDLRDIATQLVNAGLSVAPASPKTKFTTLPRWKAYQGRRMSARQIEAQFWDAEGICIICGKVSENLEMIDFDQGGKVYEAWATEVEKRHSGLLSLLVIERSQSGGRHVYYRTEKAEGNITLAADANGKLIETRGEGGLVVAWPTPGYELLQGDFLNIPTIGEVMRGSLLEVARGFDNTPKPKLPPAASVSDVGERAKKYLERCPPAVSGQRGHNVCFSVVRAVVWGFGITSEGEALSVLGDWNNTCSPPWSEKELRHKIKEAQSVASKHPFGWLRDAEDPRWEDDNGVDLSVWGAPPDPEELIPGVLDPGQLPQRLLSIPGFISQVIDFNLRTAFRVQPALALAGALSLQAVLAGRKVRDQRNNRTNLYIISLSDSGSGKDHARKVNSACLLDAATPLEGPEELASDSGLVNHLSARPSLLVQLDEIGKFLKTLANPSKAPHLYAIISSLLKLYSSANRVFMGKAYADVDMNKTIDQPNLVLHGTGVPSDFFSSLTPESLRDGLVGRFLIFEGVSRAPRQEDMGDHTPPNEILEAIAWWRDFKPGGNLASLHPQPRMVDWTPEAKSILRSLGELVDACDDEGEGWERGVWARAEEKASRLALVYACSVNREQPLIDLAAAQWACDVAEHMTRRLIYLGTSHVSDNAFDALQKRVMDRVQKNGGGITQEHYASAFHYWDKDMRQKIMNNIIDTRRLFARSYGEGNKTGREYVLPTRLHLPAGHFKRK